MTECDPVNVYLDEFAARLSRRGVAGRRVLEEVDNHLRELADRLCSEGMEPAAAARAAVERFGSPAEVIRQFDLQAPIESEVWAMMRLLLTPVVGLTTLYAGLMFAFSWFDDAPPTVLAVKVTLSAAVIAFGLVLLRGLWTTEPVRDWQRWCIFAGGLALVAAGSAGFVWTAHLGQVTGDWEYYGFVGNGLLVLQGVLAACCVAFPRLSHDSQAAC